MAQSTVLVLVCMIAASSATLCMQYTCDAGLQTNMCATWPSAQIIKINSNGCQSGYYCSATSMVPWAESTSDMSATHPCSQLSTTTTNTVAFTSLTCSPQLPGKAFKTGATTGIACNSNQDCQLIDGTYASCVCALRSDGFGTCKADISNTALFAKYWTECGSNGLITNENAANYWTLFSTYWVYTQSDLTCKGIFSEIQAIATAYNLYNGASELVLGVVGLLVF